MGAEPQASPDDFEAEAEEYERKEAAALKQFNPATLIQRTSRIYEVDHPILGKIRFGELTLEDSFEVHKRLDVDEKLAMTALLMLRKADPSWTMAMIRALPLYEGSELIVFLTNQPAAIATQPKPQFEIAPKPEVEIEKKCRKKKP